MSTATRGDLRPNRYVGACVRCNAPVAAGAGWLGAKVRGQWTVTHRTGECVERNPSQTYYERLLTEAEGDIDLAVIYLERDNEGWDGEPLYRLAHIIDMKRTLGFDYQPEVDKRKDVEAEFRQMGWL